MIRYFARLNSARADRKLLNRPEIQALSDFGAQFGFGLSVLEQRQFFAGDATTFAQPPQPLLTWPFLDFVSHLELRNERLLELGAGKSTLWFAQHFGHVRSLETDPEWQRALAPRIGSNVELSLVELATLESASCEYRGESWLLVDFAGRRTAFLDRFLARVPRDSAPCAIVLDNADWYRRGAALLQQHGYLEIPFYGFKSGQSSLSCTSLFIDRARFTPAQRTPFFTPPFSKELENDWDSL